MIYVRSLVLPPISSYVGKTFKKIPNNLLNLLWIAIAVVSDEDGYFFLLRDRRQKIEQI